MANSITTLTKEELQELQAKIIGDSVKGNRYLADTDVESSLDTSSKTIIGAINDIFAQTISLDKTNKAFLDRFNNVIGNINGSEVDRKNYDAIMEKISGSTKNFCAALLQVLDTSEESKDKVDSSIIALENLKQELTEQLEKLEALTQSYSYNDVLYTGNEFAIACKPTSSSNVNVFINGVRYDNDCFAFSNNNKTLTWLYDNDDNGFNITTKYKEANDYNPIATYYVLSNNVYIPIDQISLEDFNVGTQCYEIDKDNSDEITVRYESIETSHKDYYKDLYQISLTNNVGLSIGHNPYQNGALMNNYDYTAMNSILNKYLTGRYEYDNKGRSRIVVSANSNSVFFVLSAKNWDANAANARVYIGADTSVDSFDKFCNKVYKTETNDKTWVAFFAFELGYKNFSKIYMISDKTDLTTLSYVQADGDWYYDWDENKEGNDRAIAMPITPYLDLTAIKDRLIAVY